MVKKFSPGKFCPLITEKWPRKPEIGIKDGFEETEHKFGTIPPRKPGVPFQMFCCSWKFSAGTTIQKVMFYLFFFQTDFLETFCKSFGEQPGYLVGGGREGIMVFCTLLWMWSEGNQEKNTTIIRVRRGFQNLKENI